MSSHTHRGTKGRLVHRCSEARGVRKRPAVGKTVSTAAARSVRRTNDIFFHSGTKTVLMTIFNKLSLVWSKHLTIINYVLRQKCLVVPINLTAWTIDSKFVDVEVFFFLHSCDILKLIKLQSGVSARPILFLSVQTSTSSQVQNIPPSLSSW